MSVTDFKDLLRHKGHKINCVTYGKKSPLNVAVECDTCKEVLMSFDKYPGDD